INESNIADRYIEFIFYCNPAAPIETDISSLQRAFHAVPKSDGKTFDPWLLFQLVRKHESGEIRTWTKLAQQLGVERTDESSPQKIQQYAVRLKKWMRTIHLDAFFDYLLSKPNEYYQEPHKNPTGAEDTTNIDDEADDNDLVLKLIKRANSKRKKRKYTRRNAGNDNDVSNDKDGDKNENLGKHDNQQTSRNEEHPEKRLKVTFSEASSDISAGNDDEEQDAWEENMEIDPDDSASVDLRIARRSLVQVGGGPRWVKEPEDDEQYMYEDGNEKPKSKETKDINKRSSSSGKSPKTSVRHAGPYGSPAREILLYLGKANGKSFDHIPTPNPSPTTMPEMRYSHLPNNLPTAEGSGQNGHSRSSHSNSSSATQIKWRSISIGGGPSMSQTNSSPTPSSPQKSSKRKPSGDTPMTGHYDTFRVHPHPLQQQYPEHSRLGSPPPVRSLSWSSLSPSTTYGDQKFSSFAELLLPPINVAISDSKEAANILQERLAKAVRMLEDSYRRIEQLEGLVRQQEDAIRRKVVNEMKDDVVGMFKKWES
ncbi:hypothetical protein G9A89_006771, partial [Geosiphon pyriformis]